MIVFGFEKHWFWLKVYKKYVIVVKFFSIIIVASKDCEVSSLKLKWWNCQRKMSYLLLR